MRNQLLVTLLFLLTAGSAFSQQPFAIKPYAITLPRVTTSQQSSSATVPQQAGNVVYNTDQQAVAVHNGAGWGYLGAGDMGEFKNSKVFSNVSNPLSQTYVWAIPAGVTRFMIEAWGGGASGGQYTTLTDIFNLQTNCTSNSQNGFGWSGGYARLVEDVATGTRSMTISVGRGGFTNTTALDGTQSTVRYNNREFIAHGSDFYGLQFGGSYYEGYQQTGVVQNANTQYVVSGRPSPVSILNYTQKDATNYVIAVKLSNGGLSYGATSNSGLGGTAILTNGTTVIARSYPNKGQWYPGVGGGCGIGFGESGTNGLVIIRW